MAESAGNPLMRGRFLLSSVVARSQSQAPSARLRVKVAKPIRDYRTRPPTSVAAPRCRPTISNYARTYTASGDATSSVCRRTAGKRISVVHCATPRTMASLLAPRHLIGETADLNLVQHRLLMDPKRTAVES